MWVEDEWKGVTMCPFQILSVECRICSSVITVEMTLCNSLCVWVCVWFNKRQKSKKKKKGRKQEKDKKTYVLEVIKRDSEEPAVDLIYTGQ